MMTTGTAMAILEELGCAWDVVIYRGSEYDLHDLSYTWTGDEPAGRVRLKFWKGKQTTCSGTLLGMVKSRSEDAVKGRL